MSRRPRRPRTGLVVATLLTAGLALAGCSAGTVTQTDTIVSGAIGAMGRVGDVSVLDLSIVAPGGIVPAGGEVALRGSFVNEGPTADRLVAVSTPYAVGVRPEGADVVPGNSTLRVVAEPGPVGPAVPGTPITGTMRLALTGVTQQLYPGPTYPVTFTFERAGTVTLPVIVTGTEPAVG